MNRIPIFILYGILILFALGLAQVVIPDGAKILTNLFNHLRNLFGGARIFPPNAKFIQLFLIAVFVGWAIRRFKKRK